MNTTKIGIDDTEKTHKPISWLIFKTFIAAAVGLVAFCFLSARIGLPPFDRNSLKSEPVGAMLCGTNCDRPGWLVFYEDGSMNHCDRCTIKSGTDWSCNPTSCRHVDGPNTKRVIHTRLVLDQYGPPRELVCYADGSSENCAKCAPGHLGDMLCADCVNHRGP